MRNIMLVSTMRRNVGKAIDAREYTRSSGMPDTKNQWGFQDKMMTQDHCVVSINGHLQVMRRENYLKHAEKVGGDTLRHLIETEFRKADAAVRVAEQAAEKIRKMIDEALKNKKNKK